MTPRDGYVDFEGVLLPVSGFAATVAALTLGASLLAWALALAASAGHRPFIRRTALPTGRIRFAADTRVEESYRWN